MQLRQSRLHRGVNEMVACGTGRSPREVALRQDGTDTRRLHPMRGDWLFITAVVTAAVGAFAFVYHGFLTEDSISYGVGIIDLADRGIGRLSAVFNGELSFGYYLLQWALIHIFNSVDRVSTWLNMTSALSCVATIAVFYIFVRRLFDRQVAFFASILLIFAPSFWQLSHYGHPTLPAIALFLGSLVVLDHMLAPSVADRWVAGEHTGEKSGVARESAEGIRSHWLPKVIAFVLLAAGALTMRADVLLLWGVYFGLLVYRQGNRRQVALLVGLCFLSLVVYAVLRAAFLGYLVSPSGGSVAHHIRDRLNGSQLGHNALKNLSLWGFGANIFIILSALVTAGFLFAKRRYRLLLLALAWILPLAVFLPFRAMDFSRISALSLPMLVLLATLLPTVLPVHRRVVAFVGLLVASQLVAILTYPLVVRIYPFETVYQGRYIAAVPLGFDVADSLVKQRFLTARDQIAQRVVQTKDRDVLIMGSSDTMPYYYFLRIQRGPLDEHLEVLHGVPVHRIRTPENTFYLYDADNCPECTGVVKAFLQDDRAWPLLVHIVPFNTGSEPAGLFLSDVELKALTR